jgi:2-dehydropantoate 2-reductase
MLQDIRKGWRSEIEFMNGYIVKRGAELGIESPVNSMVIQMIKAKEAMESRKLNNYIAWEGI